MFRTLGFILGSVVSVAGILLVLGVPEVHLPNEKSDQARFEAALDKIREKQLPVEALAEEPVAIETDTSLSESFEAVDVTEEFGFVAEVEPLAEPQDIFNPQQNWHDFWNPFRSEIAAQGFVSQLEKVTGLDYRIVKVDTGIYQVGFSYLDDDERRFKISQISAATGLDIPQT
jgi:hypothetical protein